MNKKLIILYLIYIFLISCNSNQQTKEIMIDDYDRLFREANNLYSKGYFLEAIIILEKLADNPKNDYAYYILRGAISKKLRRYDDAIKFHTRAISINPDLYYAYTNRGNTYFNIGKYEEALKDHTKAIEITPNSEYAYNNRGNCYFKLKQFDLALIDYDKAIFLNSNYLKAYRSRGKVYFAMEMYEKALAEYNILLERFPDSYFEYFHRLFFAYHISKEEYEKYININMVTDKNKTYKWYVLIINFLKDNIGIDEFLDVVNVTQNEENLCDFYFTLGFKYLLIDDKENAKKYFQKSVDTDIFYYISYELSQLILEKL